jgi:hypothetical protein
MLKIDIRALVDFFDVDTEAQQDASSVKAVIGEEFAVACMRHYFEMRGAQAELLLHHDGNRRLACTTGELAGYQLDGWFLVRENNRQTCYQMEIKSWSFHGIGGRDQRMLVEHEETPDCLRIKKYVFSKYYDRSTNCIRPDEVKKVLLKMRVPNAPGRHPPYPIHNPQPLLCLWQAVCEEDKEASEVFFSVPVAPIDAMIKPNGARCESGGFERVWVFSVSNYLRTLMATANQAGTEPTITLPMPRIEERIRLLTTMFCPA